MEAFTFYETKQHSPLYIKKLKPGCPLTVQVTGGSKLRFTSHLIGYEVGNYLLITLPVEVRKHFQGNLLMSGSQAVIRLLEGDAGKCLAFKSNIESCMTHPHDFIFMSFPQMVESCELRKYPRLSTCISASVSNACNRAAEVLHGRMQDVSLGGCRFCFDMPDGANQVNYKTIQCLLGDDPAHPIIRFPGEIRSQRMHHGKMQVGIKFVSDELANEKELMRLHIDRDSLLGAF